MAQGQSKAYCCTSKQGLCYWGAAFAILYGIGLRLAFWLHLQRYDLAVLFTALGLACVVNFARNRTFHCMITGPFFLIVALMLALSTARIWNIHTGVLWTAIAIVVCAAFLLERRFAS